MNAMVKSILQPAVVLMVCLGFFNLQPALADGNIDNTYKYAWSENTGWQNFRPAYGGVTVANTYLSGYAWSENIGWVKLGSGTGPYANTTSANWGVNHNSVTGALSGYAWSENAGWINFNPTYSGVTIDTNTFKFGGYAWAENVGYIHFQNASPEYYVKRDAGVPVILYVSGNGNCGGKAPCYATIQAAVNAAGAGVVIRIAQGDYPESITLNEFVELQGGWNSTFTTQPYYSTVYSIRIRGGTAVVDKLVIQ